MLTSALKALVKNSIKEIFDIIFMGNEKNYQNINCFFFSFPIKFFFNLILNQCPKNTRQYDPKKNRGKPNPLLGDTLPVASQAIRL